MNVAFQIHRNIAELFKTSNGNIILQLSLLGFLFVCFLISLLFAPLLSSSQGDCFFFFFFLKINLYLAALLYAGFPQLWKVRATLDAVHQLLVTVAPLIAAREIQLIYKSSLRQTTEEDKPLASKMAHRVCLLLSNYLMF